MKVILSIILIGLALLMPSCYPGWPCEEPPQDGLPMLGFYVVEGTTNIFSDKQTRASLQIIDVETGQRPDIYFDYNAHLNSDTTYLGRFWISDIQSDLRSRDAVTCPTYILKYRADDVDTLRICYKVKFSKKCSSTSFESVEVYWNGKELSGESYQREFNLRID